MKSIGKLRNLVGGRCWSNARRGAWLLATCFPLSLVCPQGVNAVTNQPLTRADSVPIVTLVAAPQRLFGEVTAGGTTYNGNYAGPLLRVSPGGTLRVRLVNHMTQDTNLHFHGILASPLGRSDNMMIAVRPGESFDYEVKVPSLQTPGLYWYHTHMHGSTSDGVMGGLSGPLLVEGFIDRYLSGARPTEQILVLKEYDEDHKGFSFFRSESDGRIMTINGRIDTRLCMRPGERQLWHIGNFGPNKPYRLYIKGHPFTIVGRDGVPALHPTGADALTVYPGSRYEVLIDAGTAGVFPILGSDDDGDRRGRGRERGRRERREGDEYEASRDGNEVGILQVGGQPYGPSLLPQLKPVPERDLSDARIDASRTIVFAETRRQYTINGQVFDHARVDTRVPLGNIEEWTVRNDSDELHVFHIHQVNFQVMKVNGQTQSFNGAVDTVPVAPHQSVTLRIAFTQPEIVGRFMYHCHVLEHEDGGMMAQIEVYDPRSPQRSNEGQAMNMLGMNEKVRLPNKP